MAHPPLPKLKWPLLVMALCLFWAQASPAGSMAEEYKLKTALIYKLAKFVTWPADSGRFGICVLGRDDFGTTLNALKGRRIGAHPISIHRFGQSEGIGHECRIVFVSESKRAFVGAIADKLADRPILTVGDSKDFAKHGGMVEFAIEGGRIGFSINLARVQHVGLKIAAPLLGIASIMHENGESER